MKLGPNFKLVRGVEKLYDPETKHKDAIYFCTDNPKILLNGICYGKSEEGKDVSDVRVDKDEAGDYILVIVYTDKNTSTFNLTKLLLYKSELDESAVVPVKIGNISAGTTVKELKNKTVSEILDDIVFPDVQPTVIEPKASLYFGSPEYKNEMVLEVGSGAPTDFNTDFNKGSVKVLGQPDLNRSGEIITDSLTGITCNNSSTPTKVILGEMIYVYQVHYDKGPEMLSSRGNKSILSPNPLPEGIIESKPLKIYGTYPYISNGVSASTEYQEMSLPSEMTPNTKLPLVKWDTKVIGAKFASEAISGTRIKFRFHEDKKLQKVEFLNTLGGNWEPLKNWEVVVDPEDKIIQGERINYKIFTTTGNLLGAIQLRFTFKD